MNRYKALRKRTGLNQTDFWGRIGVEQSCGSRYEAGRELPEALEMLMQLAYGSTKEREAVLRRLGIG